MQTQDLYKIVRRGCYKPLSIIELESTQAFEQLDEQKKQGILLIHGFTSTPAVYRELISQFSDDYNIVCPTLAGHAESLASFAESTGHDWYHSVEKAYLKLSRYCDNICVIGSSLGGVLALDLAHKHSVTKLVLLAPALELYLPLTIMHNVSKLLSRIFSAIPAIGGNIKKVDSYEIAYKKLPLAAIVSFLEYTIEVKQLGVPEQLPIKIFLGRFDQVISSKKVEKLFKDRANCHISWLESSAHVLALDNDFHSLASEIKEFMESGSM